MAYVSEKDLVDKIRPMLHELSRLREGLEALLDQVEDIGDRIDKALDEGEEDWPHEFECRPAASNRHPEERSDLSSWPPGHSSPCRGLSL